MRICGIILPMDAKKRDYNYIKVFGLGFLIFAIITIPSIAFSKGVWIYYGDFDVQQIPFYYHAHEAIKSGNFFYDWGTDLGGSLVGCYSFYLLGSPFFWLTLPFKTETVPYLMPWLSALKYAVMALTSYAFVKKHLKSGNAAFIGALLYTFSGYQGAVLVYNHFHDVLAFFPLYLLLFERLLEKKKTIGFALMTALMAIINYYFFVGIVVFLGIYFFTMYFFEEGTVKDKLFSFLRAFTAGLCGVLLSGVYLLPAISYTLGNSRLSQTLLGNSLLGYSEPMIIWAVLKNTFFLPDVSGLNSMLNMTASRVSGVGAYIPLFSLSGVIAYFLWNKEKNRYKRLLTVCAVFAAVPGLNALFSAMNSEYYARWFFMPVLIMSLVTAEVVEKREETKPFLEKGFKVLLTATVILLVISVLPAKTEDEQLTVLGALKNWEQLIEQIVFSILMVVFLYIYISKVSGKSDRVNRLVITGACFLTTATMFFGGTLLVDRDRKADFLTQAVFGESPLEDASAFYRTETDEDFYNYSMFWKDTHSISSFISTIPSSTIEFYDAMGIRRKVTSHPEASRIGIRTLLSGKYYLMNTMNSIEHIGHLENEESLKGYSFAFEKNGFKVFENDNFVPMGFCFEDYITESEYKEINLSTVTKDRFLMRYLILPDDEDGKYSNLLTHAYDSLEKAFSAEDFSYECDKRRETACVNFTATTNGFSAVADMDRDNLVFFSVPYEKGFKAYVDDSETEIVRADYGFMAVKVSEGRHKIVFEYKPTYIKEGFAASVCGMAILLILLGKNILTLCRGCVKLT